MSDNEQDSGIHGLTVQIRVLLGDLGGLSLKTNHCLGIPVITHYVAETRRRTSGLFGKLGSALVKYVTFGL